MKKGAAFSFTCAALAASIVISSLGGCFSERVAGTEPPPGDLCGATPPENVVQISNFTFVQKPLNVSAGDLVTWVNCDAVIHSSEADNGEWDSKALNPGDSFSRRFDAVGTFPYHCNPHPGMKGSVVVTA